MNKMIGKTKTKAMFRFIKIGVKEYGIDILEDLFDEAEYTIANVVKCYVLLCLTTIPGFILVGALYHSKEFVEWQYDSTPAGKWSVEIGQMYPESWYEWSNNQKDIWGLTQICYGDYCTAKMIAINEQILAEKRNEHLDEIIVLGRDGNTYEFVPYDLGRDESEYEWHNGVIYTALPIQ